MKKMKLSVTVFLFCASMLFGGCKKSEAVYNAGTYTASAQGYAGPVEVEAKFDEQGILEVRVVSHNETPGIGDRAVDELPGKIVDAGSWDVDVITTVTVTSDAIKAAVKDCMEQAAIQK